MGNYCGYRLEMQYTFFTYDLKEIVNLPEEARLKPVISIIILLLTPFQLQWYRLDQSLEDKMLLQAN